VGKTGLRFAEQFERTRGEASELKKRLTIITSDGRSVMPNNKKKTSRVTFQAEKVPTEFVGVGGHSASDAFFDFFRIGRFSIAVALKFESDSAGFEGAYDGREPIEGFFPDDRDHPEAGVFIFDCDESKRFIQKLIGAFDFVEMQTGHHVIKIVSACRDQAFEARLRKRKISRHSDRATKRCESPAELEEARVKRRFSPRKLDAPGVGRFGQEIEYV